MKRVEIVKEWIIKADEDFEFASAGIEHNDFFPQICFHFQQAAEKYLKAFVIANDLESRPIHSLHELYAICRQKNPEIKAIKDSCSYLNPFYIDTHYPVHWPTRYDKYVAAEAKEHACGIGDWVKNFLRI